MKSTPSKKDIQADLEQQVQDYLQHGGGIHEIERGKSGLNQDKPWINPFKSGDSEKPQSRTPLPDVVAAIDARKQSKKQSSGKRHRPEKKWILDDFGEPIRWVWSEPSKN